MSPQLTLLATRFASTSLCDFLVLQPLLRSCDSAAPALTKACLNLRCWARSWRRAGQPGPLTRLLSCAPEALQGYRATDVVPTVVVPSYRYNLALGDEYGPYNRPAALLHWLQARQPPLVRHLLCQPDKSVPPLRNLQESA